MYSLHSIFYKAIKRNAIYLTQFPSTNLVDMKQTGGEIDWSLK